jgi:YD repeat-containing protein
MLAKHILFGAWLATLPPLLCAATTTTYAYDALGRVTQVTQRFDADAQQTTLLYDSAGNRTSVTQQRTARNGSGPSPVPALLGSPPLTEDPPH